MATVPAPRTWTVGELLTAAKMNTDVRDGLNFLLSPPRALLHKSTNQSVTSNTFASITWNSEQYDNDAAHSDATNPSRYTAQTAGWFEFHALIQYEGTSSTGDRQAMFLKNGAGNPIGMLVTRTNNSNSATCLIMAWSLMSVGDYIEAQAWQNSGVAINVVPLFNNAPSYMTARWIGKN